MASASIILKVKWAHLGAWTWEWLIKGRKKAEHWEGKVKSMGLFKEFWTNMRGLWIWWSKSMCSCTNILHWQMCPGLDSQLRAAVKAVGKRSSCSLWKELLVHDGEHSGSSRAQVETPNVRKLGVKSNNWLHAQKEGLNKHAPVRGQAMCLEI